MLIQSILSCLAALRAFLRSRADTALEILALRQQLAVLKRKRPRPKLERLDRIFWIALRRCWSHWTEVLIIVKPETVIGWHRAGFRLYWRWRAAFALALAGDFPRAQTLANDLEERFGEDTSVRFAYLPEIRALVALNRHSPSIALDLLQSAAPYELGEPRSSLNGYFGALYPIYVRGLAYLSALQGAQAAMEFQKIIDHRGIIVIDPIGALAHLQLGRAFAMSGDTAKAKSAYQDFLSLWKDADPDIPILKQAKAEYAKLQ